MKKEKIDIKNDLLLLFVVLALTVIFNDSVLTQSLQTTMIWGLLGFTILVIWFIKLFALNSQKKISKYSNVLMKISLKERFFQYFFLPSIFYISLLFFLYFNRNAVLGYIVLGVSMILLLVLFLNVKSSLKRFYSVHILTRTVFDFLCITILYLLLNSFLRMGASPQIYTALSFVSSLILSIFVLKLHDRIGGLEMLIATISSVFVATSMVLFWNKNIFIIPAIGSLMFYLVISLWNIRFAGKTRFDDYLGPILYVILAITLILVM